MTQALLKEGSAMMLPRVTNQNFYKQMLQGLGEHIKASPGDYANIATRLGMKPVELYQSILKGSSFAMWAVNDVMMQSRIRELMESSLDGDRAGLRAIRDAGTIRTIRTTTTFVIERE